MLVVAAVVVVWKHFFGEVCSVMFRAEEVAGVRVAAGVAEDSAAEDLVAVVVVLAEVSVVAVILEVEGPVAAGSGMDSASIDQIN